MTRYILRTLGLVVLAGAGITPVLGAQAAKPRTYAVKPGDTLWDLARRFLNDPFLWPELYRINTRVVEDPHWIYPGEVLQLAAGDSVTAVPTEDTPPPAPAVAAVPAGSAPGNMPPSAPDTEAERAAQAQAMADSQALSALFSVGRRGASGAILGLAIPPSQVVSAGLFHSSGFLTEGRGLGAGAVLEILQPTPPVTVPSLAVPDIAMLYGDVAVTLPSGAAAGDTLLLATVAPGFPGFGGMVIPTGLARVKSTGGRAVATVIAVYGRIMAGQVALRAEPFSGSVAVATVPVSDGIVGRLLGGRSSDELKGALDVLFLDRGKRDGVALGDLFEIRGPRAGSAEGRLLATAEVVHLGERSATLRVIEVADANLPAGSRCRQIAKVPS